MFDIQQRYLKIVLEKGFHIPSDYVDLADDILRLKKVLQINAQPLVPCNNDLLPGNFIDDGEKIWLIDYEYSGNNDRCFELGNIWSEAVLPIESLEELVTFYFQRSSPEQFARAWLYAVFAKYGWTLWASIQSAISTIEFDFWNWGMEKYEDCRTLFASPQYQRFLTIAAAKEL
jgi:thiamine kinase-like enzyme